MSKTDHKISFQIMGLETLKEISKPNFPYNRFLSPSTTLNIYFTHTKQRFTIKRVADRLNSVRFLFWKAAWLRHEFAEHGDFLGDASSLALAVLSDPEFILLYVFQVTQLSEQNLLYVYIQIDPTLKTFLTLKTIF